MWLTNLKLRLGPATNSVRAFLKFGIILTMAALSAACTNLSGMLDAAITKIAPPASVVSVRVHYLGVCTELVFQRSTHGWVLLRSVSRPMNATICVDEAASSSTETAAATQDKPPMAASSLGAQLEMLWSNTTADTSK